MYPRKYCCNGVTVSAWHSCCRRPSWWYTGIHFQTQLYPLPTLLPSCQTSLPVWPKNALEKVSLEKHDRVCMMFLLYAFTSWLCHTLIHPYSQLSNLPPSPASKHTGDSVAIVAWQGLHDVPAMRGPDTLSRPGSITPFCCLLPQLSNLPSSPGSDHTGQTVAVVVHQGLHHVCYARSRYPFTSLYYTLLLSSSPVIKPPFLSRLRPYRTNCCCSSAPGSASCLLCEVQIPFHVLALSHPPSSTPIPSYQTSLPLRPQSIPETVLL